MKRNNRPIIYGSEPDPIKYFTPEQLIEQRDQVIKRLVSAGVDASTIEVTFEVEKYGYPYDPHDYYAVFLKWQHAATEAQVKERLELENAFKARDLENKRKQLEQLKKELGEK